MTTTIRSALDADWRRIAHVSGFLLLLVIVGLFITVLVPEAVGADRSYVVLSDSMSPTIDAGGVVFVAEVSPTQVSAGDVITFQQPGGGESNVVTHRVTEVVETDGQQRFRTKGDANEEPDSRLVRPNQLQGKVVFSVPLAGYVISFAKSGPGIIALVILPATVLVALELRDLLAEFNAEASGDTTDVGGDDA